MLNKERTILCTNYNKAKNFFIDNCNLLITLEHYITDIVNKIISTNYKEFEKDYNEASYLYPFWANYPPEKRGRAPIGDQIPWIEVGEQSVGHKLNRLIARTYALSEEGLPSGADNRFTLRSERIAEITHGLTNKAFIFLDVKSVGPRDNAPHIVVSPYQVSGDGIWNDPNKNLQNSSMLATGKKAKHLFYPSVSPIYAFTDGTIAPVIHLFVKPLYKMLSPSISEFGQPLESIKTICVPNGLLLSVNPNYLKEHPRLFFPGKDKKDKDPNKIRARISFDILCNIAPWRISIFSH